MKTLLIMVTCLALVTAHAVPFEDNCRRIVARLILEECSKGKRSIMLQELGMALQRHRTAKNSRDEGKLGELLGVPADWADDELEEQRRQYRQNIQHLIIDCCYSKTNCSREVFKGSCK